MDFAPRRCTTFSVVMERDRHVNPSSVDPRASYVLSSSLHLLRWCTRRSWEFHDISSGCLKPCARRPCACIVAWSEICLNCTRRKTSVCCSPCTTVPLQSQSYVLSVADKLSATNWGVASRRRRPWRRLSSRRINHLAKRWHITLIARAAAREPPFPASDTDPPINRSRRCLSAGRYIGVMMTWMGWISSVTSLPTQLP